MSKSEEELIDWWNQVCQAPSGSGEKKERLARLLECTKGKIRPDNRTVLAHLAEEVLDVLNRGKTSIFTAMCGGDALGKSMLSGQLRDLLKERRPSLAIGILPLDAYTMDRSERKRRGLSGNDPRACQISKYQEAILSLRNGRGIRFSAYDHGIGCTSVESRTLDPSDIIIVEGSHSFDSSIREFLALKVFLRAAPDVSKECRFVVDVVERGYTPREAVENVRREYKAYRKHIHQYIQHADSVIDVSPFWEYVIHGSGGARC